MSEPHVLIVDDNRSYREAFKRNLMLEGYDVVEAGDSEEALRRLGEQDFDVVVTDLAMRRPTEGLELIRQTRSLRPHLPIIMISAVGTFDEGAEATRLGARYVISKSKIDEEIGNLFKAIDKAHAEYQNSRVVARELAEIREAGERDLAAHSARLRQIMADASAGESIKAEAADVLYELNAQEIAQTTRQDVDRIVRDDQADILKTVDASLRERFPEIDGMERQTQESLKTAEFLHLHGESIDTSVDFSRSIGFSYCFAVENEAKARLRKRLQKFFGDPATPKLIRGLLEENGKSVSLFLHQHLLRVQRESPLDVTIDNVYQTFQRIMEHGGKYKPDGLKALGIVLLCFGRTYSFRKFDKDITVDNPLGLRSLESDDDVIRMAALLTNLQHYRNPYIHPEISVMEKLSKIRETAFDCMQLIMRIH